MPLVYFCHFVVRKFTEKQKWTVFFSSAGYRLHITVTDAHTKEGVIDQLLCDIGKCAAELMANPVDPSKSSGLVANGF